MGFFGKIRGLDKEDIFFEKYFVGKMNIVLGNETVFSLT